MYWQVGKGILIGLLVGFFAGYLVGERQGRPGFADPHAGVPGAPPLSGMPQQPPQGGRTAATGNPQLMEQLRAVEALLAKDPNNYQHLVQAGNLLYDLNNFLRAIEFYERARAIRDDSPDVLTDLGVCYRETGNFQKALELFDKAADMHPGHWQSRYNAVVVRLFDLNDAAGAQAELAKLKTLKNPQIPDLSGLEEEISRRLASRSN
ncbi:MAG: tetratricopeptide repeat protein [Thermoanaerobaculum sp.]|nr:tetratricopeptide repeat protein [Thermoanaerobaculum sp.]MDW7968350.1 tetratricopeptide repeat protein [Thermoanaerobaculum sp.]